MVRPACELPYAVGARVHRLPLINARTTSENHHVYYLVRFLLDDLFVQIRGSLSALRCFESGRRNVVKVSGAICILSGNLKNTRRDVIEEVSSTSLRVQGCSAKAVCSIQSPALVSG